MNLKILKKISVFVLILFWVFSGWPIFQIQEASANTSYYDPTSDISTGWDCVGTDCDTLGHYSSLDDGTRVGSAPDTSDYINITVAPNATSEEHGINSIIEPNINYLRLYYYAETGNRAGINVNLNNNGTSQASFSLVQNSTPASWRYIQWDNPTPGTVSGEFAITDTGSGQKGDGTVYAWYVEVDYTPVITIGTVGSQTSLMDISSTDNYLGGAFTLSSNIDTAEITEIIVSETGTVNANSNLSNLSLYYETAETCTYNGDETLFGTAASFDASENATISGSMTVGTSNICLYPVLDVGSGASDSETLELEITDSSTEVTIVGGEVTPATPVLISGTTTLQASPVVSISLNPTDFDLQITVPTSTACDTEATVSVTVQATASN